jgi:hypothetical protein
MSEKGSKPPITRGIRSDQILQLGAPIGKRLLAEILAVEMQEIEGAEDQ